MTEFPSFSVSHWPGCAKAKLQAVHTADRKLCAAVTAYASYLHTGKLYGTLANADQARVGEWVRDVCLTHSVDMANFDLWTMALNGRLFDAYRVPATVLGLTLDSYQWTAIKGLTCAGGVIGAFMGAGKTAMATAAAVGEILGTRHECAMHELPAPGGRCWIFCPLNAMPTWEDAKTRELSKYFAEVKIISIDSAHKYTAISEGDVMIVDECFPAGTSVATEHGPRSIESLVENRETPLVWTTEHGRPVLRRVTGHLRKTSPKLLEIRHAHGTLRCTPNHPIRVAGKGWVRADAVVRDDALYLLQESLSDPQGREQPVLLDLLHDVRPLAGGLGPDESAEPDTLQARSGGQQGAAPGEALHRSPGRQREDRPDGATAVGCDARTGEQLRGRDGGEPGVGLPDVLQDRLSGSASLRGDRSGRGVAQLPSAPRAGQEEGKALVLSRVDGVALQERRGGDAPAACSRPDPAVYCLEVEDTHSFFADGVLVHNCHRAGQGSARRTKALHTIRSRFRFCVCLTGTMVHAGVEKCLSIKDLAVPGLAIFARNWTAGETFKCLVKKKIGPRTVTALEKPTTEREAFNQWLAIGVQLLSPDSKEVQSAFKLPGQELHEVTLNDPWPPLEEDVARVANAVFEETGEFPHAQAVAHYLARDGLDKKLDWLAGELEGLEVGTQLVVFANYRDSLDGAEALLNTLGLSYVRVDGDVTGEDRSAAQRRFQTGEATVFLGQIHAASESMNLQCANISITLDVSWSCIDWSQALARTHRRGQLAPCLHIDLVANRLQARILDRLRQGADFSAECAVWQDLKRALPVGTP